MSTAPVVGTTEQAEQATLFARFLAWCKSHPEETEELPDVVSPANPLHPAYVAPVAEANASVRILVPQKCDCGASNFVKREGKLFCVACGRAAHAVWSEVAKIL